MLLAAFLHRRKKNYRLAKRAVFAVIMACLGSWPLGSEKESRQGRLCLFFSLQLRIFQPGVTEALAEVVILMVGLPLGEGGVQHREGFGAVTSQCCSGNHLCGLRFALRPPR